MSATASAWSLSTPMSSAASSTSRAARREAMSSIDRPRDRVAYKNEEFLDSDDARPLRILAEYLEPMHAFRRERIRDTIVFFGSARLAPDGPLGRYYDAARELARLVTAWSKSLPVARSSVRRLHRRRRRHHGGRQSRRFRGRRQDHRPQHRLAARAAAEPLHHARAHVRVPLLLHAQALVRASGARAGGVPGRLRHAGRADRDPDADADPEIRPPHPGRALRFELLERNHQFRRPRPARHDRPRGSRAVPVRRRSGHRARDYCRRGSRRNWKRRRRPSRTRERRAAETIARIEIDQRPGGFAASSARAAVIADFASVLARSNESFASFMHAFFSAPRASSHFSFATAYAALARAMAAS